MITITAKRKKTITREMTDKIFNICYRPYLDSSNPYSHNELNRTMKSVTIVMGSDDIISAVINGKVIGNKERVLFETQFFKKQGTGMIIAKANNKNWSNDKLRNEFYKGMKIELKNRLNK